MLRPQSPGRIERRSRANGVVPRPASSCTRRRRDNCLRRPCWKKQEDRPRATSVDAGRSERLNVVVVGYRWKFARRGGVLARGEGGGPVRFWWRVRHVSRYANDWKTTTSSVRWCRRVTGTRESEREREIETEKRVRTFVYDYCCCCCCCCCAPPVERQLSSGQLPAQNALRARGRRRPQRLSRPH